MEQDEDMNSFVTKSHLFGAQRALHQEQQAMSDRIDNLAADLRLEHLRREEDKVVAERLTIMVRISSLRELNDVSK